MTAPGRRARVQFRRNEPDWGGSVEIGTNPVHRARGDARNEPNLFGSKFSMLQNEANAPDKTKPICSHKLNFWCRRPFLRHVVLLRPRLAAMLRPAEIATAV